MSRYTKQRTFEKTQKIIAYPFGYEVNAQTILADMDFFDDWQERYKYIIDLGKSLPAMPESWKVDDNIIHGCQSQVWICFYWDEDESLLDFFINSDAFIVQGLIAIVMATFNHRSPQQILDFDINGYLQKLDMLKHISITRGNGLKLVIERVHNIARVYQERVR